MDGGVNGVVVADSVELRDVSPRSSTSRVSMTSSASSFGNRSTASRRSLREKLFSGSKRKFRFPKLSLQSLNNHRSTTIINQNPPSTSTSTALRGSTKAKGSENYGEKSLQRSSTQFHTTKYDPEQYLNPQQDISRVYELLSSSSSLESLPKGVESTCPSCKMPFNKSTKRKLIDSNCGHEKCCGCMFKNDQCQICLKAQGSTRGRLRNSVMSLRSGGVGSGIGIDKRRSLKSNYSSSSNKGSSYCHSSNESGFQSFNTSICSSLDTIECRESESVYNYDDEDELDIFDDDDRSSVQSYASSSSSYIRPNSSMSNYNPRLNPNFVRANMINNNKRHSMVSLRKLRQQQQQAAINRRSFILPRTLKEEDESQLDSSRGKSLAYPLKSLYFGINFEETDELIGRHWIFTDVLEHLRSDLPTNRGIIISGKQGTGKTSILRKLISKSCFCKNSHNDSSSSLGLLASNVVAYHFCQLDNAVTCSIPEFVHSVAAQLFYSLPKYSELVLKSESLQKKLSLPSCVADPRKVFLNGILRPLSGLVTPGFKAIVIDGLCDAEIHGTEDGETLASFLYSHLEHFPSWLKVLCSLKPDKEEIQKMFPFHRLSLDRCVDDERLIKDMTEYILGRFSKDPSIIKNITPTSTTKCLWKDEKSSISREEMLVNHFVKTAGGNFLFVKMTLDLISRGLLRAKSSGFHFLPICLSQIYLLEFNLRFPSQSVFESVSGKILSVIIASLNPLSSSEIFETVNALHRTELISSQDFQDAFSHLSKFLRDREDGLVSLFHGTFRDWLVGRRGFASDKFLVDPRIGHGAIALKLMRSGNLGSQETLELCHHLLKAHLFRDYVQQPNLKTRHLQASMVASASCDLTASLVSPRNLTAPNVKVSRLLLLAGAKVNELINGTTPLLSWYASQGNAEMVAQLLEFGAKSEVVNDKGRTPLMFAVNNKQSANLERILDLLIHSVKARDLEGHSAFSLAARTGNLRAVSYLLSAVMDDNDDDDQEEVLGDGLVAAAAEGHSDIVEVLLGVVRDVNRSSVLYGETPLTAAAKNGRDSVIDELLLQHRQRNPVKVDETNLVGLSPLHLAVNNGHWTVVESLLKAGAVTDQRDSEGRTCLMMAALAGQVKVLELLIRKDIIDVKDNLGRTALNWSCLSGHPEVVEILLKHGANIGTKDNNGKTPLHNAATRADLRIVRILLEKGADMNAFDNDRFRPIDRAVLAESNSTSGSISNVVGCFLKKGSKLGHSTWMAAKNKPGIMLLLLNKLLEDGNVLFNKGNLSESAHRYEYALKRIPDMSSGSKQHRQIFDQLKIHLLLNLSRTRRREGDYIKSIDAASDILAFKKDCYQAYWFRAKAKREAIAAASSGEKQPFTLSEVIFDLTEAIKLAPQDRELHRFAIQVKAEKNQQQQQQQQQQQKQPKEESNKIPNVIEPTVIIEDPVKQQIPVEPVKI